MGTELFIDAGGCDPSRLRSLDGLRQLLGSVIDELELHPVTDAWHVFPEPGAGVTGMVLFRESHLTIHSFPERGTATINLYCCRRRPSWPWDGRLREALGAAIVTVREVTRG